MAIFFAKFRENGDRDENDSSYLTNTQKPVLIRPSYVTSLPSQTNLDIKGDTFFALNSYSQHHLEPIGMLRFSYSITIYCHTSINKAVEI